MLRMALADLRESWLVWLSVSLTFVATNGCLALASLALVSSMEGDFSADPTHEARNQMMATAGLNIAFVVIVGLAVVSASTGLVVRARRGALARLALAGSTPGQVVGFLVTQLAVVSLLASVVGSVAAVLPLQAVLRAYAEDGGVPVPRAVYSPSVLAATALACVLVAVVGGHRQARVAAKLPPVEALRESRDGSEHATPVWRVVLRVLGVVVGVAVLMAAYSAMMSAARKHDHEGGSLVLQISMLSMMLTGWVLATAGPLVMAPLVRLVTAVLRLPGVSWHLAGHTVVAKSDRMVRSVTALMFAIGLVCGLTAFFATVQGTLDNASTGIQLGSASLVTVLSLALLPLLVAAAGAVGNLVMMSRQRDAELALDGILGATPAQQVWVPVFEAMLLAGVGTLLGLVMAAVGIGFAYRGLDEVYHGKAVAVFPPGLLLGVIAVCLLISVAATLLPTLPSLRRPAPSVIARLVAE